MVGRQVPTALSYRASFGTGHPLLLTGFPLPNAGRGPAAPATCASNRMVPDS
jgi:hypothetical protein